MSKYVFYVVSSLLISWSCVQNAIVTTPEPLYPYVDESLWPYFSAFEEAAFSLGFSVDLAGSGITGRIEEIHADNVAGQCSYSSFNPGDVVIDKAFWNRASYLTKEMIVFHELGHCYLHRSHVEDSFASGRCVSIMRSGSCCCWDSYTIQTRSYYIEELFAADGLLAAN